LIEDRVFVTTTKWKWIPVLPGAGFEPCSIAPDMKTI
jgi:hypothetical protein